MVGHPLRYTVKRRFNSGNGRPAEQNLPYNTSS